MGRKEVRKREGGVAAQRGENNPRVRVWRERRVVEGSTWGGGALLFCLQVSTSHVQPKEGEGEGLAGQAGRKGAKPTRLGLAWGFFFFCSVFFCSKAWIRRERRGVFGEFANQKM